MSKSDFTQARGKTEVKVGRYTRSLPAADQRGSDVGWENALHPGDIIRRRFFEPMGITQAEFCSRFGIEKSKFSRVLKGAQKITPDTATAFGDAFGMSAMFFMNLQSQHDIAVAGKTSR